MEPDSPFESLTIRLFGPLDVQCDGHPLPRLRSRKGEWLLALLILRAGRAVERGWLATLLWPDSPDTRAAHSLRMSLKDLRGALGREAARLSSPTPHTLMLDLAGAEVDVVAFDAAIAQDDRCALRAAIALYRGPLLEGCAEAWVLQERQVREQAYLAALEQLAEEAFVRGDLVGSEQFLRRAVATDPFRETAQRALMQTLAAGGSYAAAAQVHRELRLVLHREINAEPDAETQVLFQQLRAEARTGAASAGRIGPGSGAVLPSSLPASEPRTGAGAAGTRPEESRPSPQPNLPMPRTSLIGRQAEVATLRELMRREDVGLVTLTGSPGSGKTRLGLAVAAELLPEFKDGVSFVPLAPLVDPGLVLLTITQALGLPDAGSRPMEELLQSWLRGRQILLLLDNFEQVAAAAPQISALLAAAPRLKVLVTSRAALRLREEYEFPVPPLAVPDLSRYPSATAVARSPAVALFVQRARQVKSDFRLTDQNAAGVAAICQRLDGLPLALELAAARIKLFAPAALLTRLENRLDFLVGGARDLPARQRTLRSAITWSYDLLPEAERALFRRLSVFAGGFDLKAASAVCNPNDELGIDTLEAVASLLNQSLVQQGETSGEEPRFVMLETLREFGRECLTQSGEAEAIRRRHARFFLTLAEDHATPRARLVADQDNLRAALAWVLESQEAEMGDRFAEALIWFWLDRAPSEGRVFVTRLLPLLRRSGLLEATARTLDSAGTLAHYHGDLEAARGYYEESLAMCQELGQRARVGSRHVQLAKIARQQGHFDRAHAHDDQGLSIARELGDREFVARALNGLGWIARARDDLTQAAALLQESLALFRELKMKWWTSETLVPLAMVMHDLGEIQSLREIVELSLSLKLETEDEISQIHPNQGHLFLELGEYAAARSCYEEALAARRKRQDTWLIAGALLEAGHAAWLQGEHAITESYAVEVLALYSELADRTGMLAGLESLAGVALARGLNDRAARLAGAAAALRDALGLLGPDWWLRPRERIGKAVRTASLEAEFPAAWAEGSALSLEEAIAYALTGSSTDCTHGPSPR